MDGLGSGGDPCAEGDDVEQLRRWEASGAHWTVLRRDGLRVVVSLRRCDGGEEAARLVSSDPRLIAFVGDRQSSE